MEGGLMDDSIPEHRTMFLLRASRHAMQTQRRLQCCRLHRGIAVEQSSDAAEDQQVCTAEMPMHTLATGLWMFLHHHM